MRVLDIGCGKNKQPGAVGMDKVALPGVDVVHDLERIPWPFPDHAFDVVHASHVLEHLRDLLPVMDEIHRVLKPAGTLVVRVPYYRHETAFRDPTHYRFFTEQSFDYFAPDGETRYGLNYYSAGRYRVVSMSYGYGGGISWHIDRYVPSHALRKFLHLLLSKRAELLFTLVAVKPDADLA